MFLLQQVFCLEHGKESLVLLHVKNLLQRKHIKALETKVQYSKLVCSHGDEGARLQVSLLPDLSKNKFWQLELAFLERCAHRLSLNHKVTSIVTGKLGYNFSCSRAFSKSKTQIFPGALSPGLAERREVAHSAPSWIFCIYVMIKGLWPFVSNLFIFFSPVGSHPLGTLISISTQIPSQINLL